MGAEGSEMSLEDALAYASRGRGPRNRPTTGWASLTPTEMEVLRHAAEGLTNPQTAERLFVSRSTVKVHLAHIFAKLGVSTRAELAAVAKQARPLTEWRPEIAHLVDVPSARLRDPCPGSGPPGRRTERRARWRLLARERMASETRTTRTT